MWRVGGKGGGSGLIYGQLLFQRVLVEPPTSLRIHLKDIKHNPTGAVFATDLLCCDKREKKKEVIDLTNGGLYFTTDCSASAPQTEMLSHLHSIQARTEQGVVQIQKKKRKDDWSPIWIFFLCYLWDFYPQAQVRWVDYLMKPDRVWDIKTSYCKGITLASGECVTWQFGFTPWRPYEPSGRRRGCCIQTRCRTWLGTKDKKGISPSLLELIHVNVKVIRGLRIAPWDQLDKVVVEGDASASIKDGGVTVSVEVCGDDLQEDEREHSPLLKRELTIKKDSSNIREC